MTGKQAGIGDCLTVGTLRLEGRPLAVVWHGAIMTERHLALMQ